MAYSRMGPPSASPPVKLPDARMGGTLFLLHHNLTRGSGNQAWTPCQSDGYSNTPNVPSAESRWVAPVSTGLQTARKPRREAYLSPTIDLETAEESTHLLGEHQQEQGPLQAHLPPPGHLQPIGNRLPRPLGNLLDRSPKMHHPKHHQQSCRPPKRLGARRNVR